MNFTLNRQKIHPVYKPSGILHPFHAQISIVSATPAQKLALPLVFRQKTRCDALTSTHKSSFSKFQVSIIFVETKFASTCSATDPPAEWA
jgi:hypothetical protein